MQYVITALDYKDEQALERRLACRESHLEGIKKMIKIGTFISGGAILNSEGKMVGSTVHVEFKTRKELEDWLANDVYTTNNVWETVDIQECKLVPVKELINEKQT